MTKRFSVSLSSVLRILFRRAFNGGDNVVGQNVCQRCGHAQSDSNLSPSGVISINGVLEQANVHDAINDTQFAQSVCENRFWLGADNLPISTANLCGSFVGQSNSPNALEVMRQISGIQTLVKNRALINPRFTKSTPPTNGE